MEGLSLKLGLLYQRVTNLEKKAKSSEEEILTLKTTLGERNNEIKLISQWITSKLGYPSELSLPSGEKRPSQYSPSNESIFVNLTESHDVVIEDIIDFGKIEEHESPENDVKIVFSNVAFPQATLGPSDDGLESLEIARTDSQHQPLSNESSFIIPDGELEKSDSDSQMEEIEIVIINEPNEDIRNDESLTPVECGESNGKCSKITNNKGTNVVENKVTQCDLCGKLLKDSSSLKQHSIVHNDIRPFACPVCSKTFRRKFHLKTHQLVHSRERKFMCNYCGKMFLLKKDVDNHEKIHLDEKLFPCELCPKRFNLKSHLVIHHRTHTGEKPYRCDICDKAFTQSNSLRVHEKAHYRLAMQSEKSDES